MFDTGSTSSVVRQFSDPVTTALSIASLAIVLCCDARGDRQTGESATLPCRAPSPAVARWVRFRSSPVAARVHLSTAPELQSPVALGRRGNLPTVEVVDRFSECHQRSLIAHEVAHLERRDPVWFFAAELIGALSAFQPLILS